jgi:hypothetical protein
MRDIKIVRDLGPWRASPSPTIGGARLFPCIHVITKDFEQFFFSTTHMARGTYNGPVIQTNPGLLTHRSHVTHRSDELHEATTHRRAAATLGEATRREAELSTGGGDDRQKAAGRQPAGDLYGAASRARIGVTSYSHDLSYSLQILQFVCLHQIST